MREHISWNLNGTQICATLDSPSEHEHEYEKTEQPKALLIVSGGNEIRSGAHNGQAQLAQIMSNHGLYVLRYDRRGIGDSGGENSGFENSKDDIKSAVHFLRERLGENVEIIGFGNCDAASALFINHQFLNLQKLILTNPWTIDTPDQTQTDDLQSTPSAAAIRARYWAKIKNPRSLIDLFTGKIDLRKLLKGVLKASQSEDNSDLANDIAKTAAAITTPTHILIAEKDTTAMAFMAAYKSQSFETMRHNDMITIHKIDSASHSFADQKSSDWLHHNILNLCQSER